MTPAEIVTREVKDAVGDGVMVAPIEVRQKEPGSPPYIVITRGAGARDSVDSCDLSYEFSLVFGSQSPSQLQEIVDLVYARLQRLNRVYDINLGGEQLADAGHYATSMEFSWIE